MVTSILFTQVLSSQSKLYKGMRPFTQSLGVLSFISIIILLFTHAAQVSYCEDAPKVHKDGGLMTQRNTTTVPQYIVTVDPNSAKNDTCHPNHSGGGNISCNSLDDAFGNFHTLDSVKFYLPSPNTPYPLHSTTTFEHVNEVSIIANGSTNAPVVIKCDPFSGLAFLNSNNIILSHIQFVECGAVQNSTSRDIVGRSMKILQINVSLYFFNCSNIELYRVEVINSSQATGVVMYDNDGIVSITESNFVNNKVSKDGWHIGGGALAIEFTYCKPGHNSCNDSNYDPRYKKNKNAIYSITSCTFSHNQAYGQGVINYASKFTLASNSSHQAVGRGGAISVYIKGDATNNSIYVTGSHFFNNMAMWGGGLHIQIDDNSNGNTVDITGCNFDGNRARYHCPIISSSYHCNSKDTETDGGAVFISFSMHFWDDYTSVTQSIHMYNCTFTNNDAIEGGGLALAISHINGEISPTDIELAISSCIFKSNTARLGSAVAVTNYPIVNIGYLPTVTLQDCTFINNTITYLDDIVHPLGTGAVYMKEVPLNFQGYTLFSNNSGSALGAIGQKVIFDDLSTTLFIDNRGVLGGAVALLGNAYLLIGENATINFTNNLASQYGGAIYNEYSSRENVKSSIDCFIRYKQPFIVPEHWKVLFYFSNNTVANKDGQSIYSTIILPCLYGGSDVSQIFCWAEENWIYENSNCSKQIQTQPHAFLLADSNNLSSPIDAFPGHEFRLPLEAKDDFKNNVTNDSVYYAYMDDNAPAKVKPGYTHVASNYISVTGEPNTTVRLTLQTQRSRMMHVCLNINLKSCPPGMTSSNSSDKKDVECVCCGDYRRHLHCSNVELNSTIDTTYWYGKVNEATYSMGLKPIYFVSPLINSTVTYTWLPLDQREVDTVLCGTINRTGVLCGRCLDNYSVAINSPIYECVQCNNRTTVEVFGWPIAYIVLTYVPIAILFSTIVLCNLNLASSAAAGFVLYSQIVSSDFFDIAGYQLTYQSSFRSVYTAIYGILNLKSFSFLLHPFCLINSSSFNILSALCFDYIIAFFPILVIIVIHLVFCCPCYKCQQPSCTCKCCRSLTRNITSAPRTNWVNAFIAFLILSYSKFGLASMKTLQSSKLFDAKGETVDYRVHLAGHLAFSLTDYEYLGYAVGAIIIATVFVFLPPLLVTVIVPLFNWLTGKIESLNRFWCGDKVHIYLDALSEGYKPERRWFSGVYFIFRLVLFIIYCFSPTIILQYILQQTMITSLTVLVALLRPYETDFYNYWDVALLFNLGILNLFGIYMFVSGFSIALYTVQGSLVLLPILLYTIGYALGKIYSRNKQCTSALNRRPLDTTNEHTSLLHHNRTLDARAKERNRYKAITPTAPPTTSVVNELSKN